MSELVIMAWRERLYDSVSFLRRSRALSDALFIAFMRAASSEASASCRTRGNGLLTITYLANLAPRGVERHHRNWRIA